MTSYTKALYRRDPAAANEFHRQSSFEHRAQFGRLGNLTRAQQEPSLPLASFGLRPEPEDRAAYACAALCGHPACKYGCTRYSR